MGPRKAWFRSSAASALVRPCLCSCSCGSMGLHLLTNPADTCNIQQPSYTRQRPSWQRRPCMP